MGQMDNKRKLWEFEILNFLREEFPSVGMAMPNLQGKTTLWRDMCLIIQGIHEIARFHDDLVDIRIDITHERNLEFKFFALRGDLNEDYMKVVNLVASRDLDGLYQIICRYCPPKQLEEHKISLEFVEQIIEQGQNFDLASTGAEPVLESSDRPGVFDPTRTPQAPDADQVSFGKI